jgi:CHAT domain-containing protein
VKNGVTRQYVLDDMPPIRYAPSLSVLAGINQRSDQHEQVENSLLTVGNPNYPAPQRQNEIWKDLFAQIPNQRGGFGPLANSQAECDFVYASFNELPPSSRTELLQAEATEAAVRQHITSSRYVHIAAHGWVDYQKDNDNLFGALVLTPGKDVRDTQNDGLLQLREIYGLGLLHCELAVLSACETNIGGERPLEAGTSMARAFLERGAKRVICSQWSTDDRATTKLMGSFFEALKSARLGGREVDYDSALHEAMLTIRRDPDLGDKPRLWAPFVLVGAR